MSPHATFSVSLRVIAGVVFFFLVAGYAAYELVGLVRRPKLAIFDLEPGRLVRNELLNIRGRASGLVKLTINGDALTVTQDGDFGVKLLLAPGYNIITLAGADRFGRTIEERLPLVYKPETINNGQEN